LYCPLELSYDEKTEPIDFIIYLDYLRGQFFVVACKSLSSVLLHRCHNRTHSTQCVWNEKLWVIQEDLKCGASRRLSDHFCSHQLLSRHIPYTISNSRR